MKTNTNSLSFTRILDRVIELNDIKSLSNDDLTNMLLKLIKTEVSVSCVKEIRTLFKSLKTIVNKAPKFLLEEISTAHPTLTIPEILNPTITTTEEPTEELLLEENQLSLFATPKAVEETKTIAGLVSIEKNSETKICDLESEISKLQDDLVEKYSLISSLENKLTTYELSTDSTGLNIEYDNSFTMDNLLSYNSFDSVLLDIKIPKELIIQSSYFIDSNKIVNLPTLVKRGNNLEPVKYLSFNA
jgi:DNA-directed RNA polymerase subunit L